MQQLQLILADQARLEGPEEECSDGCLVHQQREAGDGTNARGQEFLAAGDRQVGMRDVIAKDGLTRAHDPTHDAGFLLLGVGNLEMRRRLSSHA